MNDTPPNYDDCNINSVEDSSGGVNMIYSPISRQAPRMFMKSVDSD